MSDDDVQMIAYLEGLLDAERERVRVLREAMNTIVAIAQHPPISACYLRIGVEALAATEDIK